MKKSEQQQCRPRDHLIAAGKLYLRAWSLSDTMRADQGKDGMPDWPNWCYLPIAGWYAVVCDDAGVDQLGMKLIGNVTKLAALGAWRMTQGIYRFDPDVYAAVVDTPVSGDIPCDVLYRLPEWCVYIETPGIATAGGTMVHGVWVYLEFDANTGEAELRFLMNCDDVLLPIVVHLGTWSLVESLERAVDTSIRQANRAGLGSLARQLVFSAGSAVESIRPIAEKLLSLVLYLCSQNAEIGDGARVPKNPEPKRTKRGMRFFAPSNATTWDVGVRMGAALRRAYRADTGEADQGGTHAGPRAHIRRAHWHGFRSGPMKRGDGSDIPAVERKFALRWLSPIAVNVDDVGDLPAIVHKVTT